MKLYMQHQMDDTSAYANPTHGLIYYMSGLVPQSNAELKSIIDPVNVKNLHALSVGNGRIRGTISYDSTNEGKYRILYSGLNGLSFLKGVSYPLYIGSTTYYWTMPSRVYREDNLESAWGMPPTMLSNPSLTNNCFAAPVFYANYDTVVRAQYSDASSNYVHYTVEYDTPITINNLILSVGLWCVPLGWSTGSFYAGLTGVVVYAWNESTSSWTTVLPMTVRNGNVNGDLVYTLTATQAKKFRIGLRTARYHGSSYDTPGIEAALRGLALVSSTSQTFADQVPDITWGVVVPIAGTEDDTNADMYRRAGAAWYSPLMSDVSQLTLRTMSYTKQSWWMHHTCKHIPAIIDSASEDSASGKMLLSKSESLTIADRPLLLSYSYCPGDLS